MSLWRVLTWPLGVRVTLLPGVDHMGVVHQPVALAAIVAAAQ
jgi:hypothetical protein